MSEDKPGFGLSADVKSRLLNRLSAQMANRPAAGAAAVEAPSPVSIRPALGHPSVLEELAMLRRAGDALGLDSPFFRMNEGLPTPWSVIDGRRVLNFCAYNYLGLNGDPRVTAAANAAGERYGTSVSGSRITSGERQVHRDLEAALAAVYQADDAVVLVNGHATNVTVISHLVGPGDAVICDALSHNSIIQGAQLAGAKRRSFLHNDLADLDRVLGELGDTVKRRLVVIEGCYGMDGDAPDLAAMIPIIRRHRAHLMVDEAHALGVLGERGLGVAEHCGVDPREIDVWMGTLSKTLATCGGFIAGSAEMVDYLRASAPGFLFSVGMPAPTAAASLEALRIMLAEPERMARLRDNGQVFVDAAKAAGLDVGETLGRAIIPVIIGSSLRTTLVADLLWKRGVAAQPILYPGVPERSARLRFFVTSEHSPDDLRWAVSEVVKALAEVGQTTPQALADLRAKLKK
jgi:7-keto-8-aminopelargonate synthetase-like enzyme